MRCVRGQTQKMNQSLQYKYAMHAHPQLAILVLLVECYQMKSLNHSKYSSLVTQPLILQAKYVPGTEPALSLSDIRFWGNIGKACPDALTQHKSVCVFPFSADVMVHTVLRPSSVTTFPGVWTIEMPHSSICNLAKLLDRLCCTHAWIR